LAWFAALQAQNVEVKSIFEYLPVPVSSHPRMSSSPLPIVLGSQSKWRKEILSNMGYQFEVINPNIDEKAIRHDDPYALTLKIAKAKALAIMPQLTKACLLITSDQVILHKGQIREKPESVEQCREFLRSYSLAPAEAICGVVVTNTLTGKRVKGVDVAKVTFSAIPETVIDELIAQGDIMECAGGFALELLEKYLLKREGERETVIGLPKTLTKRLIEQAQEESS